MPRPRRIAFDGRYINDRYHGIGRCAFQLLEALARTAPEHTFIVFRGQGQDSRFDWDALAALPNIELRSGPWPLYWPHEHLRWPLLLRRERADLFHSPYFVAPLVPPCPTVVTVHDLIFDRYPEYMPQSWARPYYRGLMKLGLRRSQRVITVSQATADDVHQLYGVPRERLRPIPNGVDEHFLAAAAAGHDEQVGARYGLHGPFVLAVGVHRPHKNYGRLVRAFAGLAPQVPHQLLLVGQSDERFPDEAREAAAASGLNGRIVFQEWVPEADLPRLYAQAQLVAVPSLIEGFGLPALEALAAGTPVVASDRSSLPEVVGEAGLLVDPHDEGALRGAMLRLLTDDALREMLGRAGRERAASFTWRTTAEQTLKVYEELLG